MTAPQKFRLVAYLCLPFSLGLAAIVFLLSEFAESHARAILEIEAENY